MRRPTAAGALVLLLAASVPSAADSQCDSDKNTLVAGLSGVFEDYAAANEYCVQSNVTAAVAGATTSAHIDCAHGYPELAAACASSGPNLGTNCNVTVSGVVTAGPLFSAITYTIAVCYPVTSCTLDELDAFDQPILAGAKAEIESNGATVTRAKVDSRVCDPNAVPRTEAPSTASPTTTAAATTAVQSTAAAATTAVQSTAAAATTAVQSTAAASTAPPTTTATAPTTAPATTAVAASTVAPTACEAATAVMFDASMSQAFVSFVGDNEGCMLAAVVAATDSAVACDVNVTTFQSACSSEGQGGNCDVVVGLDRQFGSGPSARARLVLPACYPTPACDSDGFGQFEAQLLETAEGLLQELEGVDASVSGFAIESNSCDSTPPPSRTPRASLPSAFVDSCRVKINVGESLVPEAKRVLMFEDALAQLNITVAVHSHVVGENGGLELDVEISVAVSQSSLAATLQFIEDNRQFLVDTYLLFQNWGGSIDPSPDCFDDVPAAAGVQQMIASVTVASAGVVALWL